MNAPIKIVIREELFIRGLRDDLISLFCDENTFPNPKRLQMIRMFKKYLEPGAAEKIEDPGLRAKFKAKKRGIEWNIGKIPEKIMLWRLKDGWLALPRGYLDDMLAELDKYEVSYEIEERFPEVPEMSEEVIPTGELYQYQIRALSDLMDHETGTMQAPVGSGKCLGKGTQVLMFDGLIKTVENIHVGDILMGPDSTPRYVLSTCIGNGPLYRITPIKGDSWICNGPHVLTLVHTVTGDVIDIPLNQYITTSRDFKNNHKLFFVGVNFPTLPDPLPLDPYFLGVWFGDGSKGLYTQRLIGISKPDPEIIALCHNIADKFGLEVHSDPKSGSSATHRITGGRKCMGHNNPLLDLMREIVGENNNVPINYLTAHSYDRAAFLAGWLDTDGSRQLSGYEISQKRKDYAEALCFLSRSLGLRATCKEKIVKGNIYYRIYINGVPSVPLPLRIKRKIPLPRRINKNATRTGFKVENIGDGQYFGFTLSGDGRFMLGDFTVTHNTNMLLSLASTLNVPTLIVVHTTLLLKQTVDRCREWLGYDPGVIGGGKYKVKDITVGMIQSLSKMKIDKNHELYNRFGCVVVDEHHHSSSHTYMDLLRRLPYRYKYGVTGTSWRKDKMECLFFRMTGPVTSIVRNDEVEHAGKIIWPEIRHIFTDFFYDMEDDPSRWGQMITALATDPERNQLISREVRRILLQYPGSHGLILTDRIDHAVILNEMMENLEPALLHGELKTKEKKAAMERVNAGAPLTIATIHLMGEGIDVKNWDLLFLVSPLAGGPRTIQAVGRIARAAPGKDRAILFDFVDSSMKMLKNASYSRARLYRNKGEK